MATLQASHKKERMEQLIRIMESRKDLSRDPQTAMQTLLWEKYSEELTKIGSISAPAV